jgi:dTMP kinase
LTHGLFITFEGPEGSGKSTHARRVAERLTARGYEVVPAREPGGTPTGEAIREILQHDAAGEPVAPQTELLLFAASRAQLVQRVIKPALARGAIVICDRFADSTTAYQGYGRGFDVERVLSLNDWATSGVVPDVTLLMDLDVALGFERIHRRNLAAGQGEDRFEREALIFHQRVRDGYLTLAARWPERFRIILSDQPVDVVQAAAWDAIAGQLPALPEGVTHEG